MSIITAHKSQRGLSQLGYFAVGVGVAIGILGWVKSGAIVIAIGTAGLSLSRNAVGRVERYMPLALALGLLALAIALP